MIRYVVDGGSSDPIEDVRCTQLRELGFRRDGAYRADSHSGEVWIDESGTTMVSVHRAFGALMASMHTVLEDGTHVSTEERGPWLPYLILSPAMRGHIHRTSLRFPDEIDGMKTLLAAHRSHVAEIAGARGTTARAGGDVATFTDFRHEAQRRAKATHTLFTRVGAALGGLSLFGGTLIGVLQEINGRPELFQWVGLGAVLALVNFLMGLLFFGPALVRRGSLAPTVPAEEHVEENADAKVALIRPNGAWALVALWVIGVAALFAASLKGAASLPFVVDAFVAAAVGLRGVSGLRDRKGDIGSPASWKIESGVLHVDGARPLALSGIASAVRNDERGPTLVLVDRRGHVAMRLSGTADTLDRIYDGVRPERASLPVAPDLRTLLFLLAPLLTAVVVAFGRPSLASAVYAIASTLVALAPLLYLRKRAMVDVGVDGLVIEGRFLAFTDVATITTTADRVDILERSGTRTSLTLAHEHSAAAITRRWREHDERTDKRDEAQLVRRRIAVDEDTVDEVPYRARVAASPEELGEALLDSAEPKSVRLRAARRLARVPGEEATRIREEVDEQVVDPDVRHALGSPDD